MTSTSDICRLCAQSNYCVPIFGEESDRNLLRHKLRVCSPVIVKPTDVFPKQICLNCISSIDQCYEFHQRVKFAQLKLEELINLETKNKRHHLESNDKEDGSKRMKLGSKKDEDSTKLKEPTTVPSKPPLFVSFNMVGSTPENSKDVKLTQAISSEKSPNAESNASLDIKSAPPDNPTTAGDKSFHSKGTDQKPPPTQKLETDSKQETANKPPVKEEPSPSPRKQPENLSPQYIKCRHCDSEFPAHLLPVHESLHLGKKVFTCEPCNSSFFNEEAYNRHVRRHHSGK